MLSAAIRDSRSLSSNVHERWHVLCWWFLRSHTRSRVRLPAWRAGLCCFLINGHAGRFARLSTRRRVMRRRSSTIIFRYRTCRLAHQLEIRHRLLPFISGSHAASLRADSAGTVSTILLVYRLGSCNSSLFPMRLNTLCCPGRLSVIPQH